MSSLVRPVGPDDQRIYWIRRLLVVLVLIAVVALVMWLLRPSGDNTVATVPSGDSSTTETTTPSNTPTTESETPSASETTTPAPSAPASESAAAPPATPAASSPTPTPTPTGVAACKPADLRVTLTGPPNVKAGQAVSFELSVINGGSTPCTATLNGDNLELKVYSGTDRIWTTAHCTDWVPAVGGDVEPEKSLAWSMAWPAKRSADKCTIRDLVLKPGTYVATAQLDGAQPVQHVMKLS